ncbi:MAG TPA: phosphatase PAP2 family protein [Gemmatimonadaceae bacterium]|nr:phosphatase PAP2 family protein [Gemmatimonadaceae bacterium]
MTATGEQTIPASTPIAIGWRAVVHSLSRPYKVTIPMVVLVMLVPLYLVIAGMVRGRPVNVPAIALDNAFPLQPTWALIYGSLYAYLIVLPVLVVRQQDHIRRTVWAYLTVWIVAYVVFLMYPTVAPRPTNVEGDGFGAWGLRALYGADPPYNCFPSIHVAHSFVSALTCYRVHRHVGITAIVCAVLVALSTLYTKQHYVVDVIGGVLLAVAAYAVFLRNYPSDTIPEFERRLAPTLAVCVISVITLGVATFWFAYRTQIL